MHLNNIVSKLSYIIFEIFIGTCIVSVQRNYNLVFLGSTTRGGEILKSVYISCLYDNIEVKMGHYTSGS